MRLTSQEYTQMDETSTFLANRRYAVVTGGNKGIGLEICQQLASQGVAVILTARDEKRGLEALQNLKNSSGISPENLYFHQLDVTDPASIASLADFLKAKFGKIDILVNNAAIVGIICDFGALKEAEFGTPAGTQIDYSQIVTQTYELEDECLKTNYYGVKGVTEALLPLLHLSDSPRIVNVSSELGKLENIPNERVRGILSDTDNLIEEKVDEVLSDFLNDFKLGALAEKGWEFCTAYDLSKAALNAYTRILAKKYPFITTNSVCPGYVSTDANGHTGHLPVEEGGARPVRIALMPHGSPSGLFFVNNEASSF